MEDSRMGDQGAVNLQARLRQTMGGLFSTLTRDAADRIDALEQERAVWEAETAEARRQSSLIVQEREKFEAEIAALKAKVAELELSEEACRERVAQDKQEFLEMKSTLEARVKELEAELIDSLENRHNCLILDGAFRDEAKARIAELEKTLQPFVDYAVDRHNSLGKEPRSKLVTLCGNLTVGACEDACKALLPQGQEPQP